MKPLLISTGPPASTSLSVKAEFSRSTGLPATTGPSISPSPDKFTGPRTTTGSLSLSAKTEFSKTTRPQASTSLNAKAEFSKTTGHQASTSLSAKTEFSKFIGPQTTIGPSISPNADKFTSPSTSSGSDRFTGFITSREAGVVQGVGEVGDAGGIRYWPLVVGRPVELLKVAEVSAPTGGGQTSDVPDRWCRPETAISLRISKRSTSPPKATGPQQIHLSHSIHRPPESHQRCNNLLMPVNRKLRDVSRFFGGRWDTISGCCPVGMPVISILFVPA